MLLVFGPQQGFSWDNTRMFARSHFDQLVALGGMQGQGGMFCESYGTKRDFLSFKCAECERILPLDIAQCDHVLPQAGMRYQLIGGNGLIQQPIILGGLWSIPEKGKVSAFCFSKSLKGSQGQMGEIPYEIIPDNPVRPANYYFSFNGIGTRYKVEEVLKNDIKNLQLLCPTCNTSKNDQVGAWSSTAFQLYASHLP